MGVGVHQTGHEDRVPEVLVRLCREISDKQGSGAHPADHAIVDEETAVLERRTGHREE
jgi:hypothetical protein